MTEEVFYEQIIRKPQNRWDPYIRALKPIAYFLLLISMLQRRWPFIFISFLFSIFAYFLPMRYFVDYEYELTNHELVISKVKNNQKRESIARLDVRQLIEIRSDICSSDEIPIRVGYGHENRITAIFETEIGKVGFCMNLDQKMKGLLLKQKGVKEEV